MRYDCQSSSMSTSRIAIGALFSAILAGTWLASIPVAEVVFRVLGDAPSPDLKGLYISFADGNYKQRPFVDTYAFYASGRLTVHTDGLGLRCDEARHFAAKTGDAIDVLLI